MSEPHTLTDPLNNATSSTSGTVTVDYPNPGALHSQIVYSNIGTVTLPQTSGTPPSGSAYVATRIVEILGRPASPQELTSFTNYLNGNGSLALVTLLESCPTGLGQTVQRYFQELLGRPPNADELRTGVLLLQQGNSEVSMLSTLMGMPAAFASLDFRKREVTLDFQRILGRPPSQDELNAYANNVNLSLTVIRELLEVGSDPSLHRFG